MLVLESLCIDLQSSCLVDAMGAYGKTIGKLTRQLRKAAMLADSLERQHRVLAADHHLLVAVCDLMQWIRQERAHCSYQHQAALAEACPEEARLLEQLASLQYHPCPASCPICEAARPSPMQQQQQQEDEEEHSTDNSSSWCSETEQQQPQQQQQQQGQQQRQSLQPISPPDKPLHLARHMLSLPPFPGADSVTLQELQVDYAATLRELSLCLHMHDAGLHSTPGLQQTPLKRIQSLLQRHMHIMMTVMMSNRNDVIAKFSVSDPNSSTAAEAQQELAEADNTLYDKVVSLLDLDLLQQRQIVAGMKVFARLSRPVLDELRQLQTEVASSSPMAAACQPGGVVPGLARSEEQQEKLARIHTLMKKEYFLKMLMKGHQYGCLSYVQLARALVLLNPFPCLVTVFAASVAKQLQQAEQQQQQQ